MCRQTGTSLIFAGILLSLAGCAAIPTPPVPATPAVPDLAQVLDAASNAETSVVAITQPGQCCPRQTLPQFLGVRGVCGGVLGIIDRIRNRLGMMYPGLEAKPPLLAITDPANFDSPNPAISAAAGVKAQEDQAAQKIKALRYLATIGCGGCYPDVEAAFLAGMDDCTEEVRFEAVKAIRETAGHNCCYCSGTACCSKKIQEKLIDLAYGKDEVCCDKEPSERVRRMARLALCACCPAVEPAEEKKDDLVEPEKPDPLIEGGGNRDENKPQIELPTPPSSPDTLPVPPDPDRVTVASRRLPPVVNAPVLAPAIRPATSLEPRYEVMMPTNRVELAR